MRPRITFLALLTALGLAAPGCGKRDEKQRSDEKQVAGETDNQAQGPQGQSDPERVWDQMVALMETLAEIAVANEDDCAQMAAAIDAKLQENKSFLAQAQSTRKAAADDRQLQEKYQPRVMQAMAKLMPPLEQCKDNQALQRAVQKLGQ